MSPDTMHGPSARHGVSHEEAKAWAEFHRLITSSPAFAGEVTRLLDTDPVLKRQHLALYLRGKACLCRHAERQQRRQNRRQVATHLLRFVSEQLIRRPWAALTGQLSGGAIVGDLSLQASDLLRSVREVGRQDPVLDGVASAGQTSARTDVQKAGAVSAPAARAEAPTEQTEPSAPTVPTAPTVTAPQTAPLVR